MASPPAHPKVYHITHGKNLVGIIEAGHLWSDAEMIRRGGPAATVGMARLKLQRLESRTVDCHPGTKVGHYVPFNFCPRSVMLFMLHKGDSPDLDYKGGQRPIVHLEADFHNVVRWANGCGRPWAFTDTNAASAFFQAFNDSTQLDRLNWNHIANDKYYRSREIKEAKMAEFLVFESLPWKLVERIGVVDDAIARRVEQILETSDHRPHVVVKSTWYY